MSNYYSEEELKKLGVKTFGDNVKISKKASLYSPEKMSFGNNVRVDDFCILSGNIKIGNYVHISAFSGLYGGGQIIIGDFCGCSPRSLLLSASDDFSGKYMISPMVPEELTNVTKGKIVLENYCQVGANSVILPNVILREGAVTGAMTLVKKDLEEWSINCGIPAKKIKDRNKNIIELKDKI